MRVIDSHVHTGENWSEPVEVLLYQMDSNGVSHAVLVGHNGNYDNGYLLECVRRYEGRFKAVGLVDAQDPDRIKTLETFQKQGGSGFRINLRKENEWDPDNSLFKAAGDLGMIVSVIGEAGNFRSARFKKLLDKCPGTHFCLEHLVRSPGSDVAQPPYAGYTEALECASWPNTTVKVPGLGEILRKPGRLPAGYPWDTVPPHYEMAKAAFGVQRMMWGSNFPPCAAKEGYRNALNGVRNMPIFRDGDDAEWVMGKICRKALGLFCVDSRPAIWTDRMFRMLATAAISVTALMSLSCTSSGQAYPNRPVHIVVGFGVGGPDTTARLLAAQLTAQSGQRFLVDNKPGSSGVIGAEFVAKAVPDGYTLLVAPASLASLPSLQKKLPFDVLQSFTPISQIAASEASFLVVPPSLPVKNLKELIAYAKDPANHVTYASTGIGTGSHLRMALFISANGAPMLHVPFKSPGEAAVSVMGGETQALFITTTQALPLIKAGKIRPLAYDYPTRADFLPDVPTMTEAGSAPTDLDSGWHGLFAPANTPEPVVAWLETEVRKAIATPEMKERLTNLGLIPAGGTSVEFRQVLTRSVKGMGDAARAAGIQPQ